jgi:hypothetical protein
MKMNKTDMKSLKESLKIRIINSLNKFEYSIGTLQEIEYILNR